MSRSLPRADLQRRILERVAAGATVKALAAEAGFPARRTVFRWTREEPAFAVALAQARGVAERRRRAQDLIVERIEAGWTLPRLGAEPGVPSRPTIFRWMKADPAFAQRLERARAWRRGLRAERVIQRTAYDPIRAEAFLLEVRRGAAVRALVRRAEWPDRATLNLWKRLRPDFADALQASVRFARELRLRRRRPFDPDLADAIVVAVNRGAPLRAIYRSPGLPGEKLVRRWRSEHPDFDHALAMAQLGGARHRRLGYRKPAPGVVGRILGHIRRGGAIRTASLRRGAPCAATIHNWRRNWPEFAEALQWAEIERDERLLDQLVAIAEAATPATVDQARAEIAALTRRIGRSQP